VTVGVPQLSVAEAVPSAASIFVAVGLHPSVVVVPVAVIVGAVISNVQLTVLDAVELLPQASVAVHVLVSVLSHPDDDTVLSVDVNVGVPQLSVAVADPSAASIVAAVGLQPRVVVVPVAVIKIGSASCR